MSAKTPGRSSARRTLRGVGFTLLTLVVLLGVAHGLAWRWATGMLAVGFSDWVTLRRAQGWQVDHGLPQRMGWPFAARLEVPGFAIAGHPPAMPEGFAWQTPRLLLSVAPPRLDRLLLEAEGPQVLHLGPTRIPYTTARLQALVPLDPGPPPGGAEVLVEGLHALTPQGPLAARRMEGLLTPRAGDGGLALALRAEMVALPPLPAAAAFGRMLDRLAVEAVLTGPLPLPAPPAQQAAAWRAGGGRVELHRLALRWGPLAAEGRGVLRLDPMLQPAGSGTLAVEQPQDALEALARAGLVTRRTATTAQAVLALMARTPEGGGAPRVELPVAIENGTLALARIPLLRLAPIAWPGVAMPR